MTHTQDIIDAVADKYIKIYPKKTFIPDYGKGSYVFDTDGNKYLDFAIGIAVGSLGHQHPKLVKTITDQANKIMAVQSNFASEDKLKASNALIDNGCFDLVYFSNSGTESVEAALKCARKWAYDEKGAGANEIICFENAFHGRTYGSASITYKRKSQPFFAPYVEGVKVATFNDLDSVKALISDKTAAIIVEPVQGEGGLVPASPCFLQGLRALCDEYNVCLIFDEIQAGMGRLGTFYAYQSFQCCDNPNDCHPENGSVIEPDIVTLAKGIGGGFPVGAMVAKERFGLALEPGTHGTTYGGNPMACAVVACVTEELLSDGFLDHTNAMSKRLLKGLEQLQRDTNQISDIRGKGLMVGFGVNVDIKEFGAKLLDNGLMTTVAGGNIVRLTPPLNVSADEIDEALAMIEKSLRAF